MPNRLKTTAQFIEQATQKHGDKYDYSGVEYKSSHAKVNVLCKACGNAWLITPANHLQGRGCKKCAVQALPQNQQQSHESFVISARSIHGDRYEYLGRYSGFHKHLKMKCRTCNAVFEQRADSHLSGCGCKNCQYRELPQNQPKAVSEFEDQCRKRHSGRYEYFGDYRGGRHKVTIKCVRHNTCFKQEAFAHLLQGHGCPTCRMSRGEIKVEAFLTTKGIPFVSQRTFDGCRDKALLVFDFFLPDKNTCIEYDGEQHFFSIPGFGGNKRLSETQRRDRIKDVYCETHGMKLVRIPYFDYDRIDEILTESLDA